MGAKAAKATGRRKLAVGDVVMVKCCRWAMAVGHVYQMGVVRECPGAGIVGSRLHTIDLGPGGAGAYYPCELMRLRDAANVNQG